MSGKKGLPSATRKQSQWRKLKPATFALDDGKIAPPKNS